MVRPEDELLILVPNTPIKLNRTAVRLLVSMVDERRGIAEVLAREGDTPRRRAEIHAFFTDLKAWLEGRLGEGEGRRAVVVEPFSADYCRYPVLSEVALTYRCNLSCGFCYAGCGVSGVPAGWSEQRAMADDEVCRVLDVIRRDARCPSVSFTGGEPTLRPGARALRAPREVARPQGQPDLERPAPRRAARRRAGRGRPRLRAALAGGRRAPELHDALVGKPGAFDRLWQGLENLRGRGVRVHTNTTVTRRNVGRLEAIVDLVAERGLPRLTMNLVIPCGSAGGDASLHVPYSEAGGRRPAAARARRGARRAARLVLAAAAVPVQHGGRGPRQPRLRGRRRPAARQPCGRRAAVLELRSPRVARQPAAPAVRRGVAVASGALLPGEADDAGHVPRLRRGGLLPGRVRSLLAGARDWPSWAGRPRTGHRCRKASGYSSRRMRLLRAVAVYAVLTVALTWPFAAQLHVMDAGDSAFFAWEIGWTVHALKTDPAQLPHANIFWPLRYTLGMDEPVLGTTLLIAPLAPFTDDAVLLYNVARLLTFLVSALAAYWLALELGAGEWIALAGRGAVRVLADPHRPARAPLDARHAVVAARAAVHDPLRACEPHARRARRRALLRARVPRLRLPRRDRGRRDAAGRCSSCSGAAGTG